MPFHNFTRFEPPSIRQARLRETATRLTGEVLEFNELLSENLRRFREVERRQEKKRQPTPRPTPVATPPVGIATATPTPAPRLRPPPTLLDVAQEDIARQAERGAGPGRGVTGFALSQLEQAQREVLDPIAALGLQVVESPIGGGPIIDQAKAIQQGLEAAGVPEGVSPFPRTRTFEESFKGGIVDPFAAIRGSGEEQEKAQAVLEEAGLSRSLAAQIIFGPENLLPGLGFTRVDDIARLGRLVLNATKAAPKARTAAVQTLKESGLIQDALRGVREAPEAGARLPPELRIPERFLPQGGIPGGFKPRPKGMKPGARVTGLTQEGEQIEGTLIQVAGEKAIIRDAAGNVRPVTAPQLVEEAKRVGIGERLKDIGRDFRFGPSSRTAVPSLDPSVQKFVKVLRTAKPTQRTLQAERAEELGRRAARGRVPFEAEARTPEEALRGLRGAQKGKLPEPPEFEVTLPSGEKGIAADAFTQEEVTNFINIARFSPALDRELFTRGNIIESLIGSLDKKGILFGRLPTPGELKNLERVYGAEFARELQKLRPFGERFWRLTLDALNIPRSFLAAFDLSFPFRQGVFAFARHPKEFFGNLPAMLRAAKNPDFAEQMVAAIKNDRTLIQTAEGFRPLNELTEEARLFLPDISGTEAFEARTEEFLSQLARRIPGVGFSERGFIAYGDKLRSDIFRNTLQSWARQAKPATADEIADLGIMLNVLTGRGNLPPELAKSLSFGFFAPRFAASRPQLFLAATVNNIPGARRLTGTVLGAPGQTTRVARLASQELVTSVGAGLGILALVKMSGVGDVELNPLSSDFGKIRIGKTRIDFWGGARPWATVIARMITEKRKTATGFIVPQGLVDTLTRFGRSKLSPPAALLVDVAVGETAIGEQVGTTGDILNRTLPLAIQDIKDAVEQEGATAGLLSPAALLGVGFQTYETPGEKKKRTFEETFPNRTYQGTSEDNSIVRDAIADGNNKAALEDAFQPSPEQVETEEARVAEATELGLFTLSQAVNRLEGMSIEEVLATGSEAGPEFIEAWEDYKDRVSGAVFEAVFGKDRRGSEEYLAWRDIKLQRDPVTFKPLWDEYFEAKDAAFAGLDPLLQRALKRARAPGNDPTFLKTVEAYEVARNLRRESFNLPRWIGIDAARSKQITEVQGLAAAKNNQLAAQGKPDVPSETIYELVGLDIGDAALARQAWFVRPGSKAGDELRDPRRDKLLVDNSDALFRFFPELYREELLNIVGDLERAGVR